jgi:hypothetical protein
MASFILSEFEKFTKNIRACKALVCKALVCKALVCKALVCKALVCKPFACQRLYKSSTHIKVKSSA